MFLLSVCLSFYLFLCRSLSFCIITMVYIRQNTCCPIPSQCSWPSFSMSCSLSPSLSLSLCLCVFLSLSLHNVELPSANLDSWMSSNRLSLNPFKIQLTQLLILDWLCLACCTMYLPSSYLLFAISLLLWIVLFLYLLTSIIYPELASFIYATFVPLDALFLCLCFHPWSMPLSASGLTIVIRSSLAYQNLALLHSNLYLTQLLVSFRASIPLFSDISNFMTEQLYWRLFLQGFSLKFTSPFMKPFWAFCYLC